MHRAVRGEMVVDDLDRRVQPERVLPLVDLVEATGSLAQFLRFDLTGGERHLDGVLLPQVAHVGVAVEGEAPGPHPVLRKLLGRRPLELLEGLVYLFGRGGVQPRHPGTQVVPAQIGAQHPPGREDRAVCGHDHLADAQFLREKGGVHGTAAAEGHQGEVLGIVAPVQRDQFECVHHVGVRQPYDAAGGLFGAGSKPVREPRQGLAHVVHVGGYLPAEEVVGVYAASQEVRVGGRRLLTAASVGRGSRHGAGAPGPHVQTARFVDPGYAAPAVADLHDVDHGRLYRIAGVGAGAFDPVLGVHSDLAVLHEGALGGRAADVQGYDVRLAYQLAQGRGTEYPAHRPGLDHGYGVAPGRAQRGAPAVRLHDEEPPSEPVPVELALQRIEVPVRGGMNVGGEHRRVRPLVLPPLARYVVRGDDRHARQQPFEDAGGLQLVGRVSVRVHEADRHRLHAFLPEEVRHGFERFGIQRYENLPLVVEALVDFLPEISGHEGLRLGEVEVVEVGTVAAGDLQHVAEAAGRDEARFGPPALRQRVDDHGGAVGEELDLRGIEAGLAQTLDHTPLEIRRGGVHLDGTAPPGFLVEVDEVGEGAAHVGRHTHLYPECSSVTAARGLSSGDVRSDEEHQYPERRHQDDDDDPGPVPCASGRRHSSPPFSGVEEVFARAQVHRFRSFPPEVDYVLVPDPEAALQIDPGLDAEHVADLQRLPVAVPQIGLLVHLEPEAVPRPVQECVPVAGLLDHRSRRPVYFLARDPRLQNREGGVVRLADDLVGLFHLFFEVAREVYAGDVGPVAVDRAAEIHQEELIRPDGYIPAHVVRHGRVRPGRDQAVGRGPVAELQVARLDLAGQLSLREALEVERADPGDGLVGQLTGPSYEVHFRGFLALPQPREHARILLDLHAGSRLLQEAQRPDGQGPLDQQMGDVFQDLGRCVLRSLVVAPDHLLRDIDVLTLVFEQERHHHPGRSRGGHQQAEEALHAHRFEPGQVEEPDGRFDP